MTKSPIIGSPNNGQFLCTNGCYCTYYIACFSQFMRPGAKRIAAASHDAPQTTAFPNPNGKVAVVVMNSPEKEQPFQLRVKSRAAALTSRPHSIPTLVVQ